MRYFFLTSNIIPQTIGSFHRAKHVANQRKIPVGKVKKNLIALQFCAKESLESVFIISQTLYLRGYENNEQNNFLKKKSKANIILSIFMLSMIVGMVLYEKIIESLVFVFVGTALRIMLLIVRKEIILKKFLHDFLIRVTSIMKKKYIVVYLFLVLWLLMNVAKSQNKDFFVYMYLLCSFFYVWFYVKYERT
ncbi:MAG: hypothetical protein KDD52_04565 [Bdellovibrionales bacterium]|nr:hypothetical protein [Bdellovibrionales bacterium]